MNVTEPEFSTASTISILTLSFLSSFITISGNLLVLASFYYEPSLRIASNYFIVSLAITDLLIGFISMNVYSIYIVLGYWPLNALFCDLWLSMDYTACLTSQYTVLLITIDRFCSIKIPMKYQKYRTNKLISFMIILTWIIPAIIFYSIIMSWPYVFQRERSPWKCYAEFALNPLFITILTLGYFWTTLIVMISLYIAIYKVALNLEKRALERRAKINNYIFTTQTIRSNNINNKIENEELYQMQFDDKDEDYPDDSNDNLRHSQSSSMILSPIGNVLPNISSPLCLLSPRHEERKAFDFTNINCNTALAFIDLDNLNSSLNRIQSDNNLLISTIDFDYNSLNLSPVWKRKNQNNNNNINSDKNINKVNFSLNINRNDLVSTKLKENNTKPSSLHKVAQKIHGAVIKTRDKHYSVNRHRNRAKKALRTISLILGAFLICWTPFHIVVLIKAGCENHETKYSCVNEHLDRLAYWLCYINSPINPFCYALANVQIKETFLKIIRCQYKR